MAVVSGVSSLMRPHHTAVRTNHIASFNDHILFMVTKSRSLSLSMYRILYILFYFFLLNWFLLLGVGCAVQYSTEVEPWSALASQWDL